MIAPTRRYTVTYWLNAAYSFSDLAIRALDAVHASTGLPWWATIVVATVAVRGALLPITVKSVGCFICPIG